MRRTLVEDQQMYVRVGEAIRAVRRNEALSCTEMARRLGVTLTHLQRVESGETACALHLLVRIADEFDLTLDALVPVAIDEKELVA